MTIYSVCLAPICRHIPLLIHAPLALHDKARNMLPVRPGALLRFSAHEVSDRNRMLPMNHIIWPLWCSWAEKPPSEVCNNDHGIRGL